MKHKHILNIGYPKSATSWLWMQLTDQSWFSCPREKENYDLIQGVPVSEYEKDYLNFNITANFSTINYCLDRYIINQLSQNKNIVVTIILRNPFDYYWSFYNFTKNKSNNNNYSDTLKNLFDQGWFAGFSKIIDRWKQYFGNDRFFIFLYDEICNDPKKFVLNYCDQLKLPEVNKISERKINVTEYTSDNRYLNDLIVEKTNQEIDNIQSRISFDIQHWKL
jgi:hypothetical protein